MRILVANDDGIDAPGIKALVNALYHLGDIYVAAPAEEQTAKGHSMTFANTIRAKEVNFPHTVKAYKIWGTPKDCVDVALDAILDFTPDLIVTGINRGPNVCNDCVSSGTVGAATAGFLKGVASIATSLDYGPEFNYDYYGEYIREIVAWFAKQDFNKRFLLNVNLPNTGEVNGIVVATTGGKRTYPGSYHKEERDGYIYFKYPFDQPVLTEMIKDLNHDLYALQNGYITIQPMDYDLVQQTSVEFLREQWNKR